MTDKAVGYLGIMRKANALAIGEKDSGAAVKGGKAKVLCLALDASANAQKRAETFVYGRGTPLLRLPYEKAELSARLGKPGCSMLCILDAGFASAFVSALAAGDAAAYGAVAEQLRDRNGKSGKRRNNV